MSVWNGFGQHPTNRRPATEGARVWVAPLLLGLVFVVLWPTAGFPWWPPALVVALAVLVRILRFGTGVIAHRRAIAIAATLVAATMWALSPWLVAISAGLLTATLGLGRVPRRAALAAVGVAVAIGAGAGWTVTTMSVAGRAAADDEQAQAFNRERGGADDSPATAQFAVSSAVTSALS